MLQDPDLLGSMLIVLSYPRALIMSLALQLLAYDDDMLVILSNP
jgi:hypothetical protein